MKNILETKILVDFVKMKKLLIRWSMIVTWQVFIEGQDITIVL